MPKRSRTSSRGPASQREPRDLFNDNSFLELAPERYGGGSRKNREKENKRKRRPGRTSSSARTGETEMRARTAGRKVDWNSVWNKVYFFFCAGLLVTGALLILIQYMRVFSKNTEVSDLREQLAAAEDSNAVLAAEAGGETMNNDALYTYALGSLGMVEAGENEIIKIVVTNQSFTTSNLPTQDPTQSKVRYHWFD